MKLMGKISHSCLGGNYIKPWFWLPTLETQATILQRAQLIASRCCPRTSHSIQTLWQNTAGHRLSVMNNLFFIAKHSGSWRLKVPTWFVLVRNLFQVVESLYSHMVEGVREFPGASLHGTNPTYEGSTS